MAKSTTAPAVAPSRSAWFQEFLGSYEAGESCAFMLAGGGTADYERPGASVPEFLSRSLIGAFEVIALYSVSKGVYFPTLTDKQGNPVPPKAMRARFLSIVGVADEEPDSAGILMAPEPAVALLLDFLRKANPQSACVIIERLDDIVGEVVPVDANVIRLMEMLHNAGTDDGLEAHGNPLIMLTPSLEEIRVQVRRASAVTKIIDVPLPGYAERLEFAKLRIAQPDMADVRLVDITLEQLASLTAGLLRRHVENIMLRARAAGGKLTRELAMKAQRELMDIEYAGVVKRIDKPFRWKDIGGHVEALAYFKKRNPPTVLLVGPPGTGKTMVAVAMANESGMNCLEVDLAALMGGIVGETEKNVALLRQAIVANAPTKVFMDEVDQKVRRGEGGPDSGGGGAVENRLFSSILEMTGDVNLKEMGVQFIFASNRPDLLDDAFMSRMQAIVPLLPADTDEARADVLWRILKRLGVLTAPKEDWLADVPPTWLLTMASRVKDWSGRDLEQVAQEALETVKLDGVSLEEALDETITWRRADTKSVATQIKKALDACKDLRLVPERYRPQVGQPSTPAKPEWGGTPKADGGKPMHKLTWNND